MGRLGFGAGRFRARRRRPTSVPPVQIPAASISPSASWTGTAASGFTTTPADPTRTTAKPAMRLIVPPHQAFTDELLVGVYAGANNAGSLLDNMGLTKVTAHYEGTSVDIAAPSLQTFADANGNAVTYFGWWVKLKRDGRNGVANLYFEAVPADATMQHRVIGPYKFLPSAALYDYDVEVAATSAEIAGVRYKSFPAAATYLRSIGAARPRIRITEAANYVDTVSAFSWPPYLIDGYLTFEATVPVTFAKAGYTTDVQTSWRLGWERVCFRGSNITFDTQYVNSITAETAPLWLDGVNFINSGTRNRLVRKTGQLIAQVVTGAPYFTECVGDEQIAPYGFASLVRGCVNTGVAGDYSQQALCVIGNTASDISSQVLLNDVAALTVSYGGAGASATIERAGNVFTLRVSGTSVSTFTIASTEAAYIANTNYTVENVVAWINGVSGFNATTLNGTRAATHLCLAGQGNVTSFAATSVKPGPLTLYTSLGYHVDIYQQFAAAENIVCADNRMWDASTSSNFLLGSGGLKDALFLNNAIANKQSSITYNEDAVSTSQLSGTASHVVFAHNTMSRQRFVLTPTPEFNPDGYCLYAGNSVRSLAWTSGTDADLTIKDNHLQSGTAPAGASGTTIGGSDATLFVDSVNGNFTPAGALLTNLKTPVVKYDQAGTARRANAAAGALS